MNRQQSFTRKGKPTVTVTYHRDKKVADRVADSAHCRKLCVSRSVSYFRDPISGVQGRLHVVTVRPQSEWQKYAQKRGYGVS